MHNSLKLKPVLTEKNPYLKMHNRSMKSLDQTKKLKETT